MNRLDMAMLHIRRASTGKRLEDGWIAPKLINAADRMEEAKQAYENVQLVRMHLQERIWKEEFDK